MCKRNGENTGLVEGLNVVIDGRKNGKSLTLTQMLGLVRMTQVTRLLQCDISHQIINPNEVDKMGNLPSFYCLEVLFTTKT